MKEVNPGRNIESVKSKNSDKTNVKFSNIRNFSLKKVRPLSIKKHRRGKRNSTKSFTKSFLWVGNNIAGARSKWPSVQRWVRKKTP